MNHLSRISKTLLSSIALLICFELWLGCSSTPQGAPNVQPATPQEQKDVETFEAEHEMRPVWVATAWGIDWPKAGNADEQIAQIHAIADQIKAIHCNMVILQVRACEDRFYEDK